MIDFSAAGVPRWLKLAFTLWILVWAPSYVVLLGAQNFFWLCNVASFLLLVALWSEQRTLMSMQWLAVALVGSLWSLDVATAALTGVHPIGGTEYMFDPEHPLMARAMSLYHVVLPLVAGIGIARLGYARRALLWQTLLTWIVVPLTYLLTEAERNINWVHGPFGQPQDSLNPLLYLFLLSLLWPVIVYLPVHLLMIGLQRWRSQA
ncbi:MULTISPECIES: hypothetical protein [Halomonadaceae]|jgi:hypothetical protein|uniref:hypothetical protein n=1 Tax=Halomonadaceae TaxID=28256 RepID=UPI0012F09ED9|nr:MULTISPECIES: hypothetical protein [Halomonas]CAD5254298.1 conserved membrane hypothetical protein [Halomonas sp. I3]CAD5254553.1 conserved membrane hypothetical protein [Halomonas sp. 156]CAD5294633.1 conserved membrane hypothetical protein [Halomonas sp. 113]CAD5295818.1 conserved membrane hypothetical protein [Halomonas sp. 59]VXB84788.1 conserved membrane hypothetical protein [Halomonas titanicae]